MLPHPEREFIVWHAPYPPEHPALFGLCRSPERVDKRPSPGGYKAKKGPAGLGTIALTDPLFAYYS